MTFRRFIVTLLVIPCLQTAAQSKAEQFELYNDIAEQSSDPSSYYAVVASYQQKASKMSDNDINKAKVALRTELFKLMKHVPARTGQYDISSFISNPSFDNSSSSNPWYNSGIDGWTTPSNYFKIYDNSGLAECYNTRSEARIYQVLGDMPEGDYTVKVQGFYRNGEWKQALANYERGQDVVKASLYVDDALVNGQPLKSIFADGCYMLKGKSNKSADVYAVVSGRGYPHSHYIGWSRTNPIKTPDLAKQTFEHGHYWNDMTVHHADGDLTIGISLTASAPSETWIAIDNFRLYYSTPVPVIIEERSDPSPIVADDTYADVVLKKQFKADELTPLAVPCDIPASKFKAVYAIGSLDEKTQTAVLCPVDHVNANVPCYVVANEDADEITVANTYIAAAQCDQMPVMWDGGLVYRVPGTFSWKTLRSEEHTSELQSR